MKRGLIVLFFILLLINHVYAIEIDPKIDEELNKNQKVSVIIKFKEQDKDKPSIKANILSSLNENEFTITWI